MATQSTCTVCGGLAPNDVDVCSIECDELQDVGNPKAIFAAIVKQMELRKADREYNDMSKARELRRLLRGE
jgi:hypothetical protein